MLNANLALVLALSLSGLGVSIGNVIDSLIDAFTVEAQAANDEQPAAYQPPSTLAYTLVGSQRLTESHLLRLLYLQWPQSPQAIDSLLGPPEQRDGPRDYYQMPNGNQLTIVYNDAGMAYTYQFGDSQ